MVCLLPRGGSLFEDGVPITGEIPNISEISDIDRFSTMNEISDVDRFSTMNEISDVEGVSTVDRFSITKGSFSAGGISTIGGISRG